MATTYPAVISTTSLDGTNGFRITGTIEPGYWENLLFLPVEDVTGDGLDDLLLGYRGGMSRSSDDTMIGKILPGTRSGFAATVDLGGLDQFNVTAPSGSEAFAYKAMSVAGDLNDDGFTDLIIAGRTVVFGTKDGFPASLAVSEVDGRNGFAITDGWFSGTAVGDANGDGIDDLLVNTSSGNPYLLYGRKDGLGAKVQLASTTDAQSTQIVGLTPSRAHALNAVGDISGDGTADFMTWDYYSSLNIVFGKKGGLGSVVNVGALNGKNGFVVAKNFPDGVDEAEFSYRDFSVAAAGDVNGDGIGDLFVHRWNPYARTMSSDISIVFGKKEGFDAKLDLTKLDGTNGFRITPETGRFVVSGDFEVGDFDATVGDFNGDGIEDLAFSIQNYVDAYTFGKGEYGPNYFNDPVAKAYQATNVYVIYGRKDGFASQLSTAELDGTRGFAVTGLVAKNGRASLTTPGDLNGDGIDDLAIETEQGDTGLSGIHKNDNGPAGYVIFGKTAFADTTRNGTAAADTLTGTKDSDVLNGAGGNDRLIGGAGDDRLDGGRGADRMEGGLGNDTYRVDNAGDTVIEAKTDPKITQDSRDTVITTVNYTLTAGQAIEILQADSTSRADLKLVGNEVNNVLIGNAGNNLLVGSGAWVEEHYYRIRDTLFGGAGNDTYVVDQHDRVSEADGNGNDLVLANSNFDLAATGGEVERLQLLKQTGSKNLNLSGNQYTQTIIGNDGRNVLDGNGSRNVLDDDGSAYVSLGADSLYGKRGSDVYVIRRSDDKVFELVGQGHDTVTTDVSYKLAAGQEIEALQFRDFHGKANLDLTGNEFANTIYGNAGDNVLDGGLGADVLNGRLGADHFAFSTKLGAGNVDRIADFDAKDTIQLSKAIFAGLSPGQLAAGAFKDLGIAGAKLEAEDRIVYDSRTGALAFDADGSGAEAAVQFATLANRATLTAADFLIV